MAARSIAGIGRSDAPNAVKVVVLTGGAGAGKSAFADALARLGVPIIDTDAIAHRLTAAGGAAITEIRAAFGDVMIDASGALDRAKMRALVFGDAARRRELEALLHPRIRDAVDTALTDLSRRAAPPIYAVVVIPLFFERASFAERGWYVLAVDCPVEAQLKRVAARPGLNVELAAAILRTQVDREERRCRSDEVIENHGNLADLAAAAAAFDARMRSVTNT
jgi:dephospho-CoA kinase